MPQPHRQANVILGIHPNLGFRQTAGGGATDDGAAEVESDVTDGVVWQDEDGEDLLRLDTSAFTAFGISRWAFGSTNSPCAFELTVHDTLGYFSIFGDGDFRIESQMRMAQRTGDPGAVANHAFVYSKDVAGSCELFARTDSGVHQLTPPSSSIAADGTSAELWYVNNDDTVTLQNSELRLGGGEGTNQARFRVQSDFANQRIDFDYEEDNAGGGTYATPTTTSTYAFGRHGGATTSRSTHLFMYSASSSTLRNISMELSSTGAFSINNPGASGGISLLNTGTGSITLNTGGTVALIGVNITATASNTMSISVTNGLTISAGSINWGTTTQAFGGQVVFSGTISPTQLTADQNNYNPANLATTHHIRQDVDATGRSITGLQGGAAGRRIVLTNIGASGSITLVHASGSSTAANQFVLAGAANLVITTGQSVELIYDGSSSRWRVIQ